MGLKQENPLSPFLFIHVAERVSGLFARAVELGLYTWFRVGLYDLVVSNHQYEDDTLLLVVHIIENPWSINIIIRRFELALGLWVNFFKSILTAVNVDDLFGLRM